MDFSSHCMQANGSFLRKMKYELIMLSKLSKAGVHSLICPFLIGVPFLSLLPPAETQGVCVTSERAEEHTVEHSSISDCGRFNFSLSYCFYHLQMQKQREQI